MAHHGGQMVAPYPSGPGGYGDPQAPPPGFNMNYDPGQPPVVMYQPGPAPGPEYGGHPGAISPAPFSGPVNVPVGVPPGLEYLTQVVGEPLENSTAGLCPSYWFRFRCFILD